MIFKPTISTPRFHRKIQIPTIEIILAFFSNRMEIREEKLITEMHDFIGSLGGSLGMFFGFSISASAFYLMEKCIMKFMSPQ